MLSRFCLRRKRIQIGERRKALNDGYNILRKDKDMQSANLKATYKIQSNECNNLTQTQAANGLLHLFHVPYIQQ